MITSKYVLWLIFYFLFQRLDVVQQKCENEKEAEKLVGEKTEMTDKYDSLKSTLETSRSSMMQVKKINTGLCLFDRISEREKMEVV